MHDVFVDEVTISVTAGKGGDGRVSMRREKYVPRGGPDGGDGGHGGRITIVADRNLATLIDQRMRREHRAEAGQDGGDSNKAGRDGSDLEIRVPVGTLVHEIGTPERRLADLTTDGARVVVAYGGRGGRGNAFFKGPTRQAPDFAEPGRPGESRQLRLSLKLLADVGLVGFPNAGKSTLLRRLSAARPRVAAYPFTTLIPHLGVVEVDERRFVVADLPGLIEGASEGAGLGDRFLRHVERTRVLVHVVDAGALAFEERDLLADYAAIRAELIAYEPALAERAEIVALNKIDLLADREVLAEVERELRARGRVVVAVSGATGEGLDGLLRAMQGALAAADAAEQARAAAAAAARAGAEA